MVALIELTKDTICNAATLPFDKLHGDLFDSVNVYQKEFPVAVLMI
jgi:hypothetical protein